jgi:putative RNA 2'-phosphotransferase
VDLALPSPEPPDVLFYGTATRFLESIMSEGMWPGARQQVHLSSDIETSVRVGARHGKPDVLTAAAKAMHDTGHALFLSENGVWLTDTVSARFSSGLDVSP